MRATENVAVKTATNKGEEKKSVTGKNAQGLGGWCLVCLLCLCPYDGVGVEQDGELTMDEFAAKMAAAEGKISGTMGQVGSPRALHFYCAAVLVVYAMLC